MNQQPKQGETKMNQQPLIDLLTETLVELLTEIVGSEDSPCDFDHNENCREHNSWRENGTCVVAEARDLVGLESKE